MSIPIVCPACGRQFQSHAIGGRGGLITVTNSVTRCPHCRSVIKFPDGEYEFDLIGRVIATVRSPGTTRDNVIAFQELAQSVRSGNLSKTEAGKIANDIGPHFGNLLSSVWNNDKAITQLLAVIGIILTLYTIHSADESSMQQHTDAQNQSQGIATLSLEIQNETQVQQRIYEEIQKQRAVGLQPASPSTPTQPMKHQTQGQTPDEAKSPMNRRERRMAAKLARKSPPATRKLE